MQASKALRALVEREGMPQMRLSKEMGMRPTYLAEHMSRNAMTIDTLSEICGLLGYSLDVLDCDGTPVPFPFGSTFGNRLRVDTLTGILASLGFQLVLTAGDGYAITLSPPDGWGI